MKRSIPFFFAFTLVVLLFTSQAQDRIPAGSCLPLKTGHSMLSGPDVFIHNQPLDNQRNVCLAVSFNGWLYAGVTVVPDGSGAWETNIYRSRDNGATWYLYISWAMSGVSYLETDMVVCGTTEEDLKLYFAGIEYSSAFSEYSVYVYRINGLLPTIEDVIYAEPSPYEYYDVRIASDYLFPGYNVSPYSLGLVYSRTSPAADSIIFRCSTNGGVSFDKYRVVETTDNYYRDLDISYGRSLGKTLGRYHVAWEELDSPGSLDGRIFTARNIDRVYSSFTTPFRLDNTTTGAENLCRQPAIASQFNNINNDHSNYTAVVLTARDYNAQKNDYDVIGFYNMSAADVDNWTRLDVQNDNNNTLEPDITFDPEKSTFYSTLADSTDQKLRILCQHMDMSDPSNWSLVEDKYNDLDNLGQPFPRIEMNNSQGKTGMVWSAENIGGNGAAMFDQADIVTGTPEQEALKPFRVTVSPNPARDLVTIGFSIDRAGTADLRVVDLYGRQILNRQEACCQGTNKTVLDIGDLSPGYYIVEVAFQGMRSTCRLVVTE
jgi:hypothetical protein